MLSLRGGLQLLGSAGLAAERRRRKASQVRSVTFRRQPAKGMYVVRPHLKTNNNTETLALARAMPRWVEWAQQRTTGMLIITNVGSVYGCLLLLGTRYLRVFNGSQSR